VVLRKIFAVWYVKSCDIIVEQDHRFIKKRVRSMLGFKSYKTDTYILSGIEAMHMIKKGKFTTW
jgi:IS6 family transposase